MTRRSKRSADFDAATSIFGDEQAAAFATQLQTLAEQVAALEDQMRSQFTSVATYAAIASEQVEFARNEARADLDRTRDTLVRLMEQLRNEVLHPRASVGLPGPTGAPTPMAHADLDGRVLQRLADVERAVEQIFDRQRELAEMVAAVFDSLTAAPEHEPVHGLALL
jgi:transposase